MKRTSAGALTIGVVGLLFVIAIAGCGSGGTVRPSCSAGDPECGEGWSCVMGDRPFCPGLCDPTYTCYAQGILVTGDRCLGDGECREGLHCSSLRDGSGTSVCRPIECATSEDCAAGEVCREQDCVRTSGAFCLYHRGEYGCSAGEVCVSEECVPAPETGGNECEDDSFCAPGLECSYNPQRRGNACTSCASAADCTHPDYPYCHAGQCDVCDAALCAEDGRVCRTGRGCFECATDADCPEGQECAINDYTCRHPCAEHSDCPPASGQCERGVSGVFCVAELGEPCEVVERGNRDCHEGVCTDRDASGATVTPYCTRTCGFGDLPCPEGTACVPDVPVERSRLDLCLPSG